MAIYYKGKKVSGLGLKGADGADGQGAIVIDTLNSTDTAAALSANQGRVLDNKIDTAIQTAIQNTWDGEY